MSLVRNIKRCLKFLIMFWIGCIVVAVCGIFLDPTGSIPGDIKTFLLNFFLIKWSYSGIWWYATIYIIYVLASPILFMISRKCNTLILLVLLLMQFLVIEAFYKINPIVFTSNPIISYLLVRIYYLLGARLLGYMLGMLLAKEKIFTRINKYLSQFTLKMRNIILLSSLFLLCAFVLVFNRGILVVLLAVPVFIIFNCIVKGSIFKNIFYFLGGQSTFIWFLHPFIYNGRFPILTYLLLKIRYPICIFIIMLAVCCVCSSVLNKVAEPIIRWITNIGKKDIIQ